MLAPSLLSFCKAKACLHLSIVTLSELLMLCLAVDPLKPYTRLLIALGARDAELIGNVTILNFFSEWSS